MSRILAALLMAVAFAPASARETTVNLAGCEYQLKFPERPEIKDGRPAIGAAKGPSQVATLRNRIPAYRFECQGFSRMPKGAAGAMIDDMLEQTGRMQLSDFHHSVSRTSLGTVVEYSGIEVRAGQRFVVSGRNMVGDSSVMSLVITEPSQTYPSPETRRVLTSIRR